MTRDDAPRGFVEWAFTVVCVGAIAGVWGWALWSVAWGDGGLGNIGSAAFGTLFFGAVLNTVLVWGERDRARRRL